MFTNSSVPSWERGGIVQKQFTKYLPVQSGSRSAPVTATSPPNLRPASLTALSKGTFRETLVTRIFIFPYPNLLPTFLPSTQSLTYISLLDNLLQNLRISGGSRLRAFP